MRNSAAYAISDWPDTGAILGALKQLVSQPMRPLKRDSMDAVMRYFDEKCPQSRALTTEASRYIPGGVQHNLAFNYPFPIAIAKARDAWLWDVDGNRYIDFLQAGGPTLLGSNYKPVQEKVLALIEACGPVTGLFHEYELKLARLINRLMPNVEMFRMLGSGTESVMAAIRAARNFTGHTTVIKVGGAYHGWSDQMVFGLHIPGTANFEAHGIPAGCLENTREVYPNDIDGPGGLRALMAENADSGGTAAVIVEPLGPESATRPVMADYNRQVRALCDEFGALLIFDEVVTGFRVVLGGAQGYFDVKPDLTVFGKCVAGGYPAAGGLGGRRDVMSTLAAGLESGKPRVYVGGTLAANPLSCAAGYYAIQEIEKNAGPPEGRPGRRSALPGAAAPHRQIRTAFCGFQPRFDLSPGDIGGHAPGYRQPQYLRRNRAAQAYDGRDGGRLHGRRPGHPGRQPAVYFHGGHRRGGRRRPGPVRTGVSTGRRRPLKGKPGG